MAHSSSGRRISDQWVLFWWLLALALLVVALVSTRRHAIAIQRLSIAGMLAAISFAVFQINIPFAGGVHMNLTRLIGIFQAQASDRSSSSLLTS